MTRLIDIFEIKNAKSSAFEKYSEGSVAFVSNGEDYESSVLGYVSPFEGDRVFYEKGICLSSFGEATIQNPPFLPRGNGGSGLLVLLPNKHISDEELYSYAAQLNFQKWKFSFARMVIKRRIENIEIMKYVSDFLIKERTKKSFSVKKSINRDNCNDINFKTHKLIDCCAIYKKTAFPQSQLEKGTVPYVSTSSKNNGISGYCDEEPNSKGKCLTVALNGSVGETFFQFDDFITGGDNAVLTLKNEYNPHFLFYIGAMIKNHQWRYNYYRKLNLAKLKKMTVPIPYRDGKIDFDYIKKIVENSYGFAELKKYL